MVVPLHSTLLAISMIMVWAPSRWQVPPWVLVFIAAVVAGLLQDVIRPVAVVFLVALCAFTYQYLNCRNAQQKRLWGVALLVTSLSMGLQLLPGFERTVVVENLRLAADSTAMRLTMHFDVGTASLFLLVAFAPRLSSLEQLRAAVRPTLLLAVVTVFGVLGLAWLTGVVRLDPKVPDITAAYLIRTIFWTAVFEECIFRALLQDYLSSLNFFRARPFVPVVILAAVFGLAHDAHFGTMFWITACAGLGYGATYYKCRSIEAPVFVHSALNAAHFLLLSYPKLI